MPSKWKSRVPEFLRDDTRARRVALRAAANPLRSAVMRGLRGGYTSGAFVTGRVMNSVTISPVFELEENVLAIKVGTNVMYALYWELGHFNLFTGKYERVEVWRPALFDSRQEVREAFVRRYTKEMEKYRSRSGRKR
jgi:hypothetical protein